MSEARRGVGRAGAGDWGSEEFVDRWAAADAFADVLAVPRTLSVAIVEDAGIRVRRVVDVGAGAGSYLAIMMERLPDAEGVWVDASEPMLERARGELARFGDRVRFVVADFRDTAGLPFEGADVIVSARAIHHFRPEAIGAAYRAAARALPAGGFLFNLDHFGTPPGWEERYRRVRRRLLPARSERPGHAHDAPAQPLAHHLTWLEEAGFEPPDVPWRMFFTALVAARRAGG